MLTNRRISLLVVSLFVSALLSGCGLIEIIAEGLARVCETDPLVVTKVEDTNDGLCTGDDCSLREAIITSNACPGRQTIEVPAGTYNLTLTGPGEDEAKSGDLDILDTVAVIATGGEVIVDGGGSDRVFHIIDPVEDAPDVTRFDGLTIQNGLADFTGGGIYLQEGWLSLEESLVRDNQAGMEGTVGGAGGGIYAEAHLTTSNSILEGNLAHGPGGGLFLSETAYLLVNDHMSVVGNRSLGGEGGGGVFSRTEAFFRGELVDNEAPGNGAGFWNGGQLEMRLTTLEQNSEANNGGGLFNAVGASAMLYEAWFTNNSADLGGAVFNQGMVQLYQSGVNHNTAFGGFGGGIYNDGPDASTLLQNTTVSAHMITPPGSPGGSGVYSQGGDLRIEFSTLAYNNADGIMNNGGNATLESTILGHHSNGNCTGAPPASRGHNLEDGDECNLIEASDMKNTGLGIDWLAMNGGNSLSHALLPGSPAVDSGDPDTCIAADQRNVSRPQGAHCDRGSYEATGDEEAGPRPGEPTPTDTEEVTATATPTPGALDPISINFNADAYTIQQGQCTTLRWAVENADRVYFEGQETPATEAEQVCPTQTMRYTLAAENEQEEQSAQVTIEVTLAPPEPPTGFTVTGNECSDQSYRVFLSWNGASDNEDGFRLYRQGSQIATLGPGAESYTDEPPYGGPYTYELEAFNSAGASSRVSAEEKGCIF